MENPRESIVAEVYFRDSEPLPISLDALSGQSEAARISVEEFDAFSVTIPSLEDLVKASSGQELEDILRRAGTTDAWMVRSVRHLVTTRAESSAQPAADGEAETGREWGRLYRDGKAKEAVEAITIALRKGPKRPHEARLYNNRGYIRYSLRVTRKPREEICSDRWNYIIGTCRSRC